MIKIVTGSLVTLYTALPLCVYFFPVVHHHFLFMNMIKWPFTNYSNPRRLGVSYACRNFDLETEIGVKIGVWHIIAAPWNSSINNPLDGTLYEEALRNSNLPVIVYLHGNTWTRSAPHRVKLYNILAENGFHVIAFDYRGYGDSTGSPSENGVVHDAKFVYKWVEERSGSNPIFVWSHSLGTAIGTAAVKSLCDEGICPTGFVLEAPFDNLGSIVRHHTITRPFRWMPWFDKIMVEPFQDLGLYFTTDERIRDVNCPMMILHAKDDRVIPFKLGEQLKNAAVKSGRDVTFHEFDAEFNYGHKYICNSPQLMAISKAFFSQCIEKANRRLARNIEQ